MKSTILVITLVLVVILTVFAGGCIRKDISENSGNMVTRTFDYTGFTRIKAGNAFEVNIAQSDNYSITVVIDKNVAEGLKVVKNGDTLEIGRQPFWRFWGVLNRSQVTITMPELRGLNLAGACEGNARGFKLSRDFTLDVSGASNLDIDMETLGFYGVLSGASSLSGYLKSGLCDVDISGASTVNLKGTGDNLVLDVSGASSAKLEDYVVTNADVDLSGASNAAINVSTRLNVQLSGASDLDYSGSPALGKMNISGASSIEPR